MQFTEPDDATCLMYLVRHGATDNNVANPPRLQGSRSNPPLSIEGLAQAEATSRFLSGVTPAAIYASPLQRAHETAEIIARPHRLPIESVEALLECDIGRWEGRDWAEIRRTEPKEYEAFMADPGVNPHPGGESMNDLIKRVEPAFLKIFESHLGQSVIAATHKNVNRAYVCHLLKMPMARVREVPQYNCGVNLLAYSKGHVEVITINAAFHLPIGSK